MFSDASSPQQALDGASTTITQFCKPKNIELEVQNGIKLLPHTSECFIHCQKLTKLLHIPINFWRNLIQFNSGQLLLKISSTSLIHCLPWSGLLSEIASHKNNVFHHTNQWRIPMRSLNSILINRPSKHTSSSTSNSHRPSLCISA